jgi:iron complex transport system permease protein
MAELAKLRLFGLEVPTSLRQAEAVLFHIRLPRIALSVLVGAALSVSGAVYQALFRNPLVAPDILGVSSGAGVGASLAIAWGLPSPLIHLSAFVFGLGAVAFVVIVAAAVGWGRSLMVLILVGVVVSSLFTALGSLVKYLATDDQTLASMVLWLMGSFAQAGSWSNVAIVASVLTVASAPLILLRWRMNALAFGEEEARAMGVDVVRLKLVIIACATLQTATSVAVCGLVGWVGLLVPHMCRFLSGPSHQTLLPASLLAGGLFMLTVDTLVRLALPGEMPVGVVTALAGSPLFIVVLCRSSKRWS